MAGQVAPYEIRHTSSATMHISGSKPLIQYSLASSDQLLCAVQNGHTDASGDAAVANTGSAYGTSALGPSAGGASTAAPANPNAHAGTQPEPMPSQPLQDCEEELEVLEDGEEDGEVKKEQSGASKRALQGLGLPFDPVALTFKDIHYFVKNPNQKSQELELLKVRHHTHNHFEVRYIHCRSGV